MKKQYIIFLEKKEKDRIDLICEHQHPTASKHCLNHHQAELRTPIQESEREQIWGKKKKRPLNSLKMKESHCHLEGEVRVASRQVKQEKDFNYYPTLPVLITLFIWRTEVTFIHSLF